MIAYKGFQKDLKCRGFQFQEYGINETEKANCRQNGFHCAENPHTPLGESTSTEEDFRFFLS